MYSLPKNLSFLSTLLLNALALAIALPEIPQTIRSLTANSSLASTQYAIVAIGFLSIYIIGSVITGYIIDLKGRKGMLTLCLATNILGFAILLSPLSIAQIFIARLCNGFGQIASSVIQASLTDLSEQRGRAGIYGLFNATLAVAFIAGSLASALLGYIGLNRWIYVGSLVFALGAGLTAIFYCNETLPVQQSKQIYHNQVEYWASLFKGNVSLFGLLGCFYGCNLSLLIILPGYLNYRFAWGAMESGIALSFLAAAFGMSQLIFLPYLLARLGYQRLLRLSMVSTVVFLLMISMSDSGWFISVLPFFNMIGFLGGSLLQSRLSERFSDHQQGSLVTSFGILASLSCLIAIAIYGLTLSVVGDEAASISGAHGLPFLAISLIIPFYILGHRLVFKRSCFH